MYKRQVWEAVGLRYPEQDVVQFSITGSWLVTIEGKRDVSVYQVKGMNRRLFRKMQIKAEEIFYMQVQILDYFMHSMLKLEEKNGLSCHHYWLENYL